MDLVTLLGAADAAFLSGYLTQFGYLSAGAVVTDTALSNAVADLQVLLGLPETGEPDARLVRALAMTPRCGCPDILPIGLIGQVRAWGKKRLTYHVAEYVQGIDQDTQNQLLGEAWANWAAVADLSFEQVRSKQEANILISVGSGRQQGFDGPQGTLAWAQLPGGDDRQLLMRFDLAETWVVDAAQRGILLLNVACHEFGHLLGLDHSRQTQALMAPFYSPRVAKPQPVDDIPRIQDIYGRPTAPVPPPPAPPPTGGGGKPKVVLTVPDGVDVEVPGYRVTKLLV